MSSSLLLEQCIAQSAGVVEYNDSFSAEEQDSTNKCPGYDTQQSNSEVPIMWELCGMRSTLSLPLLLGLLWSRMVAPHRVLSMGQIELNCILMLNWIIWNRTVFDIETVFLC